MSYVLKTATVRFLEYVQHVNLFYHVAILLVQLSVLSHCTIAIHCIYETQNTRNYIPVTLNLMLAFPILPVLLSHAVQVWLPLSRELTALLSTLVEFEFLKGQALQVDDHW